MKRRGTSLLELLIAAAMTVVLTLATVQAYQAVFDFHTRAEPERAERRKLDRFEENLRRILSGAVLTADDDTFFILGLDPSGEVLATADDLGASVVFTAYGQPPRGGSITSLEDFETLHQQYGPQGGFVELSLSTTPFDTGNGQEGLFIREQRPADGDPSQGGFESLLEADVQSIGFEAFDGVQWLTTWDSRTQSEPRLPAAIRVTYTLRSSPNVNRVMVVRMPLSDVTPEDPAATGGVQ